MRSLAALLFDPVLEPLRLGFEVDLEMECLFAVDLLAGIDAEVRRVIFLWIKSEMTGLRARGVKLLDSLGLGLRGFQSGQETGEIL